MASMSSPVAHEGLREAVAGLGAGLDELDDRDLADRLVALERVVRSAEAAIVAVVDAADRSRSWKVDGHASVRGWARSVVRWSELETRDRVRTVRLCRDAPVVAEELAAGRLGVAQVRELGRARSNPRVGHLLTDAVPLLLEHAQSLPFREFRTCVQRWEALCDVDGAHRDHEAAHEGRSAQAAVVGATFHLDARGGVLDGTALMEILERFERAEFDAEWDRLKAIHGDAMAPSLLERTAGQRRFDALVAIFERAASTAPGARRPQPVVNLVMDVESWEAWLARTVGGQPEAPLPDVDIDRQRSETTDGLQVDPAAVVAASLLGRVRRVVMDRAGVVIAMGRKQRLFTGSAREAALLQGTRCFWPGCGRRRTQIDHTVDWSLLGSTDPANAGPGCERHNLFKNRGYTVWRDEHGRWHTQRPDGTEIVAA